MDSQDSQKFTELVNNNAEPLIPILPLVPSFDSNSTPRASQRPQVPLSRFESLPMEIHITIVEELANIEEGRTWYDGLCKLAHASPVFTSIAQRRLYHFVSLDSESTALRWLESDATTRGEFTTQVLVLIGEEGHSVCAETVERVLAFQNSGLRVLHLCRVDGVESTSLHALSGLQELVLRSCDVTTAIDSAAGPTFQLQALYIGKSTFPSFFLRDIMTSTSTSLRILELATLDEDFDWTPITSASLSQLQELRLDAWHIPPLLALISGCGNLTTLSLRRRNGQSPLAIADSTNRFNQLSKELASFLNPTLKNLNVSIAYVGRNGPDVTLQEVEELIAIPSLTNLVSLDLQVPYEWAASDIEALRGNKGKKGKLVVKVELF